MNGSIVREWTTLIEPVAPQYRKRMLNGGSAVRFGHQMPGYFAVEEVIGANEALMDNAKDKATETEEEKEKEKEKEEGESSSNTGKATKTSASKTEEQEKLELEQEHEHAPQWIPDEMVQTVILVVTGMAQTKFGKDSLHTYISPGKIVCPWIFVGQTALPPQARIWDNEQTRERKNQAKQVSTS